MTTCATAPPTSTPPSTWPRARSSPISPIATGPRSSGRFLNLINRSVPDDLDVHVVVDNSSTHKTPEIHRWLLRHPRFTLHFTPTYSSWLNLVERWFAELTNKWLRRGTHRSTKELERAILDWTDSWNDNPRPFVWHKSADEILDTLATYCARISDSGH